MIWRNGSYEELFDLDADPWEENNLLLNPLSAEASQHFDSLAASLGGLHDFLFSEGFESGALNVW